MFRMIQLRLNDQEQARMRLPVHGQGGWQSLFRQLQEQLYGDILELSPTQVQRVTRYWQMNNGDGGFQGRFPIRALREALGGQLPTLAPMFADD